MNVDIRGGIVLVEIIFDVYCITLKDNFVAVVEFADLVAGIIAGSRSQCKIAGAQAFDLPVVLGGSAVGGKSVLAACDFLKFLLVHSCHIVLLEFVSHFFILLLFFDIPVDLFICLFHLPGFCLRPVSGALFHLTSSV